VERLAVAGIVFGSAGSVIHVGLRALHLPLAVAAPLAVLLGAAGALLLARRLPPELDGLRRRRPRWCALWLLLGLAALVQTARLSTFTMHPQSTEHSLLPGCVWFERHSCLTAYFEAARLDSEGEENIYRPALYTGRRLDGFKVDPFHYPPPFLLLPRAARAVTGGDYLDVRSLWFAISALAFMLAFGLVARRLEPPARLRAIAVAPVVWCSGPVQLGLQMSNFQILVVSISVIALACFPRRAALGGGLLALAVVSKIFPGITLVYLAARRRWRELAWTVGLSAALCLLALAILGAAPFRAFIADEMPRLSSGEAFAHAFARPFAVARNMAPFGIPFKLSQLGVPGMTMEVGRAVSLLFALALLFLAIRAGRRPDRTASAAFAVWLSLLSLGTLVSPFAPASYVLVTLILLVAIDRENFHPSALPVVWLACTAPFLVPQDTRFWLSVLVYLPAQMLAIGLPALVLWRAGARPRASA